MMTFPACLGRRAYHPARVGHNRTYLPDQSMRCMQCGRHAVGAENADNPGPAKQRPVLAHHHDINHYDVGGDHLLVRPGPL